MSAVNIYASPSDWKQLLRKLDSLGRWSYVPTAIQHVGVRKEYSRGIDIPDLGLADADSGIACASYLMCDMGKLVVSRPIGKEKKEYVVDLMENPGGVIVTPAGEHACGVILAGRVAGLSGDTSADRIVSLFRRVLAKEFRKVRACWVGPQAHSFLSGGGRLTISVHASVEFDLALEST